MPGTHLTLTLITAAAQVTALTVHHAPCRRTGAAATPLTSSTTTTSSPCHHRSGWGHQPHAPATSSVYEQVRTMNHGRLHFLCIPRWPRGTGAHSLTWLRHTENCLMCTTHYRCSPPILPLLPPLTKSTAAESAPWSATSAWATRVWPKVAAT